MTRQTVELASSQSRSSCSLHSHALIRGIGTFFFRSVWVRRLRALSVQINIIFKTPALPSDVFLFADQWRPASVSVAAGYFTSHKPLLLPTPVSSAHVRHRGKQDRKPEVEFKTDEHHLVADWLQDLFFLQRRKQIISSFFFPVLFL